MAAVNSSELKSNKQGRKDIKKTERALSGMMNNERTEGAKGIKMQRDGVTGGGGKKMS